MKKLLKAHIELEKIYKRLDNLIRNHEDEYDTIGYSDAVKRRFECYYKAVCEFLELFFQEQYEISVQSTEELFDLCYQKELISSKELYDWISLIDYIRYIRAPCNKPEDSELLFYTATMNEVSERLAAHAKGLLLTTTSKVTLMEKNNAGVARITLDLPRIKHKNLKSYAALKGRSMREILLVFIDTLIDDEREQKALSVAYLQKRPQPQ